MLFKYTAHDLTHAGKLQSRRGRWNTCLMSGRPGIRTSPCSYAVQHFVRGQIDPGLPAEFTRCCCRQQESP